jgi:Mrp family chromosome partitioning ATPase
VLSWRCFADHHHCHQASLDKERAKKVIFALLHSMIDIRSISVGIQSQEQMALLTDYDPTTQYSISYHNLYNNICFGWDKKQIEQFVILFASPAFYAGQSTAAANLAIAAAQNGTPTVLVDADLHKPSLQQRFGTDKQSGLSSMLSQDMVTTQQLAQYLSETFIPDLYLLGAGPAIQQSIEIRRFLSNRLGNVVSGLRLFLKQAATQPGLIIFNSPPVLSDIDAALISSHMDQTFLTIATGHTTRTQAKQAQEKLERAHAKLAGFIMLDI